MSEMIERIAKAIYDSHQFVKPWDKSPGWHRVCREEARAALEAMKVPTVEMIIRATEDWLCIRAMEDRAEVIWDAMIDEALQAPAQ